MWIIIMLMSPVAISFGSSSSCFTIRNIIPLHLSLVFSITSMFGFNLTLCVVLCIIDDFLRLHPVFLFVLYFHQDSHHPQFHQIYTHALLVGVIFLVGLIYYHFISDFFHST